jgi:hypothetical protein
MGWQCTIPLLNPGKRPCIEKWERYNTTAPTDFEIERWAAMMPNAGIGLAVGPDLTTAVDLDITDPATAHRARAIAVEVFGPTPLTRVGLPPKAMLFYRRPPSLTITGRAFGGYELYAATGQVVLHSIHPDTGRPYLWIDERPEDVGPQDLPIITTAMVEDFHRAMAPHRVLTPATATARPGMALGTTADMLRMLGLSSDPIAAAITATAHAAEGSRHATMVGAVVALSIMGFRPAEYEMALDAAYTTATGRTDAVAKAVAWALGRVGEPPAPFDASAIDAAWNRRRGRA